jgi:hypothetical protein
LIYVGLRIKAWLLLLKTWSPLCFVFLGSWRTFIVFFIWLCVWSVFLWNFYVFLYFFSFDLFQFKPLLSVSFSVKSRFFCSIHGWTNTSGWPEQVNFESVCKALFRWPFFLLRFFGLKGCLANTPLDVLWQFYVFE